MTTAPSSGAAARAPATGTAGDRPGRISIPASVEACAEICRTLEQLDVSHVFGLPGTQNVALFEALRRSRLRTIVPTHELAAAFMAGAYYRACGRPGVLATIGGPGLAYTIAGLAEARLDSAALVYLVNGRPANARIGYGLQALDQRALLAPVVKAVLAIDGLDHAGDVMRHAFALALAGEPGPVAVELASESDDGSAVPPTLSRPTLDAEAAGRMWSRITRARRPVLVLGQGALGAGPEVMALAERLQAPVLTTPSARGIVDERHPLAMGFDVLKGTLRAVNALLASSDLVVVLGAKLGHNGSAGFGLELPAGATVRVDTSAEALASAYGECDTLCADVGAFLAYPDARHVVPSAWPRREIATWRGLVGNAIAGDAEPLIAGRSPRDVLAELRQALPDDAMLVTDTGMHQVLARRYFEVRAPRGLLTPADFQSMGFGLPAAIAARLVQSSRPVVALLGDGGLRITGFELGTAVKARLGLPVIVFNDGRLNQIRLQQLAQYGVATATDIPVLDFAAFAASLGIDHVRTGRIDTGLIAAALAADRPTLIEVPVGDSLAVATGALRASARRHARGLLTPALKRRLAALRPARS